MHVGDIYIYIIKALFFYNNISDWMSEQLLMVLESIVFTACYLIKFLAFLKYLKEKLLLSLFIIGTSMICKF